MSGGDGSRCAPPAAATSATKIREAHWSREADERAQDYMIDWNYFVRYDCYESGKSRRRPHGQASSDADSVPVLGPGALKLPASILVGGGLPRGGDTKSAAAA